MAIETEQNGKNRNVRFDGTITLGNILTFVGMLGTIVMLWRNMETRVVIVEERQTMQAKALDRLVNTVERLAEAQAAINFYNDQRERALKN